MTTRTELSAQQQAFFDRLRSGEWEAPPGIRNLGIRPQDWLKEVSYGRVLYQWPNDGSRDIQPNRVFGGWVAGLSDHIVSMTMASALDEVEISPRPGLAELPGDARRARHIVAAMDDDAIDA